MKDKSKALQKRWYALRTDAQAEFMAERILTSLGFDVFLPVELKLRRKTRYCKQRVPKAFPLLTRYIFANLETPVPWRVLLNVPCVQSVVGFEGQPQSIDEASIHHLESLSSNKHFPNPHRYLRTRSEFDAGDDVLIVEGPFAGRVVPVEEVDGPKARVWLELFGTRKEVEIPVEHLEVA